MNELIILIILCSSTSIKITYGQNSNEENLTRYLLKSYDKSYTPIERTQIEITLFLRQIISLDEKNQVMTSNIYISQLWNDERLKWDETIYKEIGKIVVPAKNIWTPDLTVLNTVDGDGFIRSSESNLAILFPNGLVYLIINVPSLKTRCKMNVRKFPFDIQKCPIELGSWALPSDEINLLDNSTFDRSQYIPNSVWELIDIIEEDKSSNERFNIELFNNNSWTDDLRYEFVLKRRPLYFMINNVFPSLILNVINLIAYFLPFSSQISLTMTIILTSSVYSVRVASDIPIQSEYLPLITLYFIFSGFYSLISLLWFNIANQFIVKLYLPKFLDKFSWLIGKILCMNDDEKEVEKKEKTKDINVDIENVEANQTSSKIEKYKEVYYRGIKDATVVPVDNQNEVKNETNNTTSNEKDKDDNEKEEKKKKKKIEKNVEKLNYFMFFLMFLFILISNLTIWLFIGT